MEVTDFYTWLHLSFVLPIRYHNGSLKWRRKITRGNTIQRVNPSKLNTI